MRTDQVCSNINMGKIVLRYRSWFYLVNPGKCVDCILESVTIQRCTKTATASGMTINGNK
jgi:hypothetical protein